MINKYMRLAKNSFFIIFDYLGEILFCLLRPVGVVTKTAIFTKNGIKKILIVRLDRIGDLLLSTPAIRAVREGFPDVKIHLLVSEYANDIVITNRNIDKLLIYHKDEIHNDYDLSIALHPGLAPNYLTFISGAKYRIGYTGSGGGFFLTHKITDDRKTRIRHEVDSALEIAKSVGCSPKNKNLEVSVTELGEQDADNFFHRVNISEKDLVIAIHPGARQEYIRCRQEGFAEVADNLIKNNNAKIILIGSKEENLLVERVAALMTGKPIMAVGLRLAILISLLKRCNLFIGNSTGPMHIASALKVPVVAIFGNIHPLDSYQEWGPWGEGHAVVSKKLNCANCHPGDCRTFDCMGLISSDDVLEAARKQLNIQQWQ